MFTVKVSRTTSWEEPVWEETETEFFTFDEAQTWGEQWQESQDSVEFFDGFHNAARFEVVQK